MLKFHEATKISAAELDAVATWQGLDPASFAKPGDFLVVRTGFTKQYLALSPHDQSILPYRDAADTQFLGMEASDAMLRWLWDKKFSLVGSDNPAFEALGGPTVSIIDGTPRSLHQVFIGGWGLNIGQYRSDCKRRSTDFFLPSRVLGPRKADAGSPSTEALLIFLHHTESQCGWWDCEPAECSGNFVSERRRRRETECNFGHMD